jgi:tetratricopeptide (TPR) repeat protein
MREFATIAHGLCETLDAALQHQRASNSSEAFSSLVLATYLLPSLSLSVQRVLRLKMLVAVWRCKIRTQTRDHRGAAESLLSGVASKAEVTALLNIIHRPQFATDEAEARTLLGEQTSLLSYAALLLWQSEAPADRIAECLDRAVQLSPDDPFVRINRGLHLRRVGMLQDAVSDFQEALMRLERYVTVRFARARRRVRSDASH